MKIELSNVTKRYRDLVVLQNITFSFVSPGLYIIFGPSGSGKTTLLNILSKIEKVSSGSIHFDKAKKPIPGVIFQHHYLIGELTVEENIMLPLLIKKKKVDKLRYLEICKELHIEHLLKRKVKYCSGGETQRINIARTLAIEPDYYLADEPTGSVDEETARFIKEVLVKLSKDKLVILVTHDQNLFSSLKATYLHLEKGRLR